MKFSALLGKNLISLSYAKDLGTIFSCTVDNKLRRIYQIATVDNEENEGFIINKSVNFGEDVIFTVNTLADFEQIGILFPFRARVFDTDGKFIGKVSDFEFEKNQITEIQLAKDFWLKTTEIVVASKDLVIVKGNRKVRAYSTFPKRAKTPLSSSFNEISDDKTSVAISTNSDLKTLDFEIIENDDNPLVTYNTDSSVQPFATSVDLTSTNGFSTQKQEIAINNANDDVLQPDKSNEISPRTLISGYQFLLGRKVVKNIIQGGTLLIPRDKTIDVDTVELARKFGKLVELTVSSIEK